MNLFPRIAAKLIERAQRRPPDFIIGGHDNPYLLRWWLIPRNPLFNIYLHKFLRDDDSIVLRGDYTEISQRRGVVVCKICARGNVRCASPWHAHRIELFPWWLSASETELPRFDEGCDLNVRAPAWTLFITGPRLRNWGFHCPDRGWVPWQQFTAADDAGAIGKGCDA